jgi:MFS family permease
MIFSPRRIALASVLSATLGVGLIFGFQPPLIALVLGRNGASSFAIGTVTAATLIAVILLAPLYPLVIARMGLRGCVLAGVGCAALVLLLMPVSPNVGYWFVLRLLTGCALGLSWIASEVWLNTVSTPEDRGTLMGIYGTVFSAGVMLGPSLLEITGTRGWLPYAAGAACLAAMLVPLLLSRGANEAPQPFAPLRGSSSLLRRAPLVMLASFVAGLVESVQVTLLPLFGLRAGLGDHRALLLVTVFMAGNVVLQIPIGWLGDRFGRRRLLGLCALLSTVGPLLLQPWLTVPMLLWPLLFIWGGTLYAFYSQGVALLGTAFTQAELPTANTVFVMVYCLGGVIGPSLGGIIMDAWPGRGLPWLLSGAAGVLLAGLIIGIRRRQSPTIAARIG